MQSEGQNDLGRRSRRPDELEGGMGRREWFLVAVLFVLPFLAPGFLIFSYHRLIGADLPEFHLPHQQFIADNLRAGIIPFWNPYAYGGTPEFGNPEMAPMYPLHLFPGMLLGPDMMLRVKYLFHLGLAAAGLFLLLRALSVTWWLAFLGALTLQTSGFVVTKIALPNVGDSASWIPLMLFLNLWFARSQTLRRGLIYALAGGVMLLLFFPQITLTAILLLAILGACRYIKVRGADRPVPRSAHWIHNLLLPIAEAAVILALLRYPAGGWRHAVTGVGSIGLAGFGCVLVLWAAYLWLSGLRISIALRELTRWSLRFCGIWAFAAAIAAPQLAVTGELIANSNQKALNYTNAQFFTGAQSYGCVQEFVLKTGLAQFKECVNNMAVGPVVYLLVFAGIVGGFHRRHRLFFLLTIAMAVTATAYFAPPFVLEVIRRLPFFGKFAGLSRYLAFLNIFMILLAVLSAQMWLWRVPRRARTWAAGVLVIGLAANLVLLARHEVSFWRYATVGQGAEEFPIPTAVKEMVRNRLSPDERILVDARGRRDYVPLLMFGMTNRVEGLSGYGPMRIQAYDQWMEAHNGSLGVAHNDYRAGMFEPSPTAWTRAMRVRGFLYPPGAEVPRSASGLVPWARVEGWTLMADSAAMPSLWPESRVDGGRPTSVTIPAGWRASLVESGLHRLRCKVVNPSGAPWMVASLPAYSGWVASVNGQKAESKVAYGFLQAVRIPKGNTTVTLEYRPRSFAFGWLVFLWAAWVWIILFRGRGASAARLAVVIGAGGVLVALVAGRVLFMVPDDLTQRVAEFAVVTGLAYIVSLVVSRKRGVA